MQSRPLRILALALVAGVIAVVLAVRWISQNQPESVMVVVMTKNVEAGSVIGGDAAQMMDWPKNNLPVGTLTDAKLAIGRSAAVPLVKGEPLLESRLVTDSGKVKLSAVVSTGKRAMTIAVNLVAGVSGFVLPGTYVDVLVNTKMGDSEHTVISKIVLEGIQVLAAAQDVDRNATKPQAANVVTVEVTPEQAEALDLARNVGSLSLVLRNQNERNAATTTGMTKEKLLGIEAKVVEPGNAPLVQPVPPRRAVATNPVSPTGVVPKTPSPTLKGGGACVDIIRGFQKVTECF